MKQQTIQVIDDIRSRELGLLFMPTTSVAHRRTHNLLLASKLLNLRDSASPLTLILDSLNQSATPLVKEYIRRAKLAKAHVIFVSFETLRPSDGVNTFILARRKNLADVAKEVLSSYPAPSSSQAADTPLRRYLVIFDTLHPLSSRRSSGGSVNVSTYLSSLLGPAGPRLHVSLLAVYHQDVPTPQTQSYAPSPLSLFTYLATSIITVHSMAQILARKSARDRSSVEPVFGLEEGVNGVLIGRADEPRRLVGNEGIVLELEHRRKSGRSVAEWYFLPDASKYHPQQAKEVVILLEDHPLYHPQDEPETARGNEPLEPQSTFDLGLTERQRRERENVVLPYFDAQKGEGPGEGGRILYDMGEEDDFDEEEDEI